MGLSAFQRLLQREGRLANTELTAAGPPQPGAGGPSSHIRTPALSSLLRALTELSNATRMGSSLLTSEIVPLAPTPIPGLAPSRSPWMLGSLPWGL